MVPEAPSASSFSMTIFPKKQDGTLYVSTSPPDFHQQPAFHKRGARLLTSYNNLDKFIVSVSMASD